MAGAGVGGAAEPDDREAAVQLVVRLLPAFAKSVLGSLCVAGEANPVPVAQLAALRRLLNRDYQVVELARELGVGQSSLTVTVDTLVRRGWVERTRDHGRDRRVVVLHITPAGRAVCQCLVHAAHDRVEDLLREASADEVAALRTGLGAVERALARSTPHRPNGD